MSKTERELIPDGSGDALDEMFDDEEFDTALGDAIDGAELELDIADLELTADADEVDAAVDVSREFPAPDPTGEVELHDDVVARIDDDADDDDGPDGELPDVVEVVPHDDGDATVDIEIDPDARDLDDDLDRDLELDDLDLDDLELDVDDESDDDSVGDDRADDELANDDGADAPAALVETDVETDDDEVEIDEDVDEDDIDEDDVSDDILEELRRADIDGPVVAFAPQDESAAARRRPRRAADYDPAPVPIPAKVPRVLGRRPRVRKVTRVVRHVDPWSVFKIALLAHVVLYIIVLTASVLLWNVANATGTVDNVERFFESFGWNSFEFNGGELYHAGWIAGLFAVIGFTGLAVLAATLFNLITDLVGGVRFTVLEEEVVETRTSPMRRFVVRRAEPEVPAILHDGTGPMIREAVVDDTGANPRPTR